MPRPLSLALCGLIKSDLQNGCDLLTLKSRHRISDKKARTMKKLFDETGEVYTLHKRKGSGRPTKLKPEHVEALKGFLAQHPEALLKDMCLFMELEYQLELTESTMQRCCKKIGWSLKKKPRARDDLGSWVRTLPRDENGNAIRGVRQVKKRSDDYGKKLTYKAKKTLLEKTREFVKDYMSQPRFDASHNYDHVLRVLALSLEILRVEQNTFRKLSFDGLAVELAALMHDIDDHKYRPPMNEPGGYPSPPANMDPQLQPGPSNANPDDFDMNQQQPPLPPNIDPNLHDHPTTAPSAVEVHLLQLGWPHNIASKIGAITPFISFTAETTDKDGFAAALARYPELAIVQDADRLDALGSTGIGRAFTYGGAKGREGGMADTIKHFGEKLLMLEAMMKTGEGRRLSVVRAERLRIFGRWWSEEMRFAGMAGPVGMEWAHSVSPWANQGSSNEMSDGPPKENDQIMVDVDETTVVEEGESSMHMDGEPEEPSQHTEAVRHEDNEHLENGQAVPAQAPDLRSEEHQQQQQHVADEDPGKQLLDAIAASEGRAS